jgi:hypothetical protein
MTTAADLPIPGGQITTVLAVILSVGFAAVITAWFNGATKWRGGTQASESRAIKNIVGWSEMQEQRALTAIAALDAERSYSSDCERVIRVHLGAEFLPTRRPIVLGNSQAE